MIVRSPRRVAVGGKSSNLMEVRPCFFVESLVRKKQEDLSSSIFLGGAIVLAISFITILFLRLFLIERLFFNDPTLTRSVL